MPPRALIFDVFGTCVDWRNSIAEQIKTYFPKIDGIDFAMRWRAQYEPAMARVRTGARGYIALEQLHLENLHKVCDDLGLFCPPDKLESINGLWERLKPWPDVKEGLDRLRQDYRIAPCSNGSISMMTRLAHYGKLPWDCILGAELAQDYKPKPAVYQAACAALGLPLDHVMMVAAHNSDLSAARRVGLRCAFVLRATEYGPEQSSDLCATEDWDIIAADFNDLANQLILKHD